jgi:uncharacterized protein (TIGR02271 family)
MSMAEDDNVHDARGIAPEGEPGAALQEEGDVLRVPEIEEHLRVERRRIALGFVEIRKRVITEQVMVPVELRREVVEYRLIDDPGGVATVGEAPGDLKDDTVRIPVFREKAVVNKEIVVTSEVVIDRTLTAERQSLDETLRRSTVVVTDDTATAVPVRPYPEHDGTPTSTPGEPSYPVNRTNPDEPDRGARAQQTVTHRRE